jgi:hypothetical protein
VAAATEVDPVGVTVPDIHTLDVDVITAEKSDFRVWRVLEQLRAANHFAST